MEQSDMKQAPLAGEAKEKQKGASLVEYALLVALIAVIAIVAIRTLGQQVSGRFSQLANTVGTTN